MIRQIQLPSGEQLFVQVEDSSNQVESALASELEAATPADSSSHPIGLPEGSRETSSGETADTNASVAGSLLKSQIHGLAKMSLDALTELNPEEIKIEAHIKFTGDVKLIPFIASAKGDGGLKISLTWRRQQT